VYNTKKTCPFFLEGSLHRLVILPVLAFRSLARCSEQLIVVICTPIAVRILSFGTYFLTSISMAASDVFALFAAVDYKIQATIGL